MESERSNLTGDPPDGDTLKTISGNPTGTASEKARDSDKHKEPPEPKSEWEQRSLFVKLYKMFVSMVRDAGLTLGVIAAVLKKSKGIFGIIEKMVPSKESFKAIGSIDIYSFIRLYKSLIDDLHKKRQGAIKDGNWYDIEIYTERINYSVSVYLDNKVSVFM